MNNEKIPAHRFLLAAYSDYFDVLLYGEDFAESKEPVIKVPNVPADAFKMLLKYMYSGSLDFELYDHADLANLMELSHRYGMDDLECSLENYLQFFVNENSAVAVLKVATVLEKKELVEICWVFVKMMVQGLFSNTPISDLDLNLLTELVDRGKDLIPANLLKVAHSWFLKNKLSIMSFRDLFASISLSLFTLDDVSLIRSTKVFDDQTILDWILSESLQNNTNLSDVDLKDYIDFKSNDQLGNINDEFFASYTLSDVTDENNCILVELKVQCIVNNLQFDLEAAHFWNYYIEVSKNKVDWKRIIDFSKSPCKKRQNLFFTRRAVKYFKFFGVRKLVAGKWKNAGETFSITSLAILNHSSPELFLGKYIYPTKNVATLKTATAFTVHPGEQELAAVLLNGSTLVDKSPKTYTTVKLNEASIVIFFHQPYLISSCRFRLWDLDSQKYSYKIEINSEEKNFHEVCNRSESDGWQTVTFTPRPVFSMRITGLHSTMGNDLRLVHFECPASSIDYENEGAKKRIINCNF